MLKFLMKYKVRDRVQEYSSGPFGLGRAIEARDHMRSLGFVDVILITHNDDGEEEGE